MNGYWIILPVLVVVFVMMFKARFWGGAVAMGALIAFDLFAAVIVTLGDRGILPLG